MPYQSRGERAGALALMIASTRSPMLRSGSGSAAMAARTAASPSAFLVGLAAFFVASLLALFSAIKPATSCGLSLSVRDSCVRTHDRLLVSAPAPRRLHGRSEELSRPVEW